MNDKSKTKEQLINELVELRQQTAKLEASETERKRTKEALRESEEKYKFLVDNSKEIALILSKTGKILFANKIALTSFGYSEQELIGKSITHFVTKDSIKEALFALAQEFLSHPQLQMEIRVKAKSGEIRYLEVTEGSTPVHEKGKLIGVMINARDITTHKREELLRQVRAQLLDKLRDAKTIEDCLQVGCEAIRDGGLFERAVLTLHNEKREITDLGQVGLDPKVVENARKAKAPSESLVKEMTRKEFRISHSFFVPTEAGVDFKQCGRYVPQKSETNHIRGSWKPGDELFVPVVSKRGLREGYLSVDTPINGKQPDAKTILHLEDVVDIVARQVHEIRNINALRESEEKYRQIFDNISEGIYQVTPDGQILLINPALVEVLGYDSVEEIMKINVQTDGYQNPADRRKFIELMEKDGQVRGFEAKWRRKDGTVVFVKENAKAVRDEEGKILYYEATTENITSRVRQEQERKRLEAQLIQAQRMEAVGQFAGGIAHDFNNMLLVILGRTELALMKAGKDSPLCRHLNQLQEAAMRAADLTRQLLLFSRRQPMEMVPLDLNRVIHDLTEMLSRLIGEDISLMTDLESDICTVKADVGSVEQVITNLVVNAQDAIPEGGEITIRTENVDVDEEYCKTHKDACLGKFVCLSVQDTGVGIDQAVIDRIFEPFFSTKDLGKGTGLGLSVVYGIVKQHEGWLNVESSPGEGAIFRIYLPTVSVRLEEKEKKANFLKPLRGKGERILVVEDEKPVRDLTTAMLSENGYRVFAAANALEALDIFEKKGRDFDLIFCDVRLPDQRGPKLTKWLLKLKPGISVLFTSGYSKEKSDWRAIQEGGHPFLQKPYSLSDLLKAIRDALKER